uniref:YqaJ viral recombinase domain-containing protein n=1 Tax=Magallana gigas TaxID=29159 RepID=A0A8W8P3G7_MAGGI
MATRENSNDQKRKRKGALTDLPIKYQATTLMGHLWNIPDESPVFESEVEVESTEDPRENAMKALILSFQWGVDKEEEALKDYLTLQNAVTDLTTEASGLIIYPIHPFLGASSDGRVHDKSMPEGNQTGVLEIKCPYSISGKIITDKEDKLGSAWKLPTMDLD